MLITPPQKEKIVWTTHSKEKMRYYKLSEKRVLNILRRPGRKEEGIAPGTLAAMQPTGTKKHPTEAWVMYQTVISNFKNQKTKKIKIISAWRYPGITPKGTRPIIPENVLEDLKEIIDNS
ncbi:MAG: hypothetical protein PHF44_02160 [Candidatus Pacebacteria bacterium]|nr:hypothetical protein [Candidatus Paceibacterota bacterium]